MAEYIIMPKLEFNMDKGEIVKWFKREGDEVKEREPIFQIETDKTVMDIEASIGGILRKIFLEEGQEIPVSFPIGIIGGKNEDIEKMIQKAQEKLYSFREKNQEKTIHQKTEKINFNKKNDEISGSNLEEIKISPRAKKLANQLSIDLERLKKFKEEGIVYEEDVKQFQKEQKKELLQEKIEKKIPYTGMRKIIGERLAQSKFTAPHIYFTSSVDMQKSLQVLEKINQNSQSKITINDLIVYIVANVLEKNKNMNISLIDEQIIFHNQINIGIAVAVEEGLIVPVIKEANKKNIFELSGEIKEMAQLARQRKLTPENYKGGTFTISNLGMYDVENFTAIINPPEAAILAVGKVQKKPVVVKKDGESIEIHSTMKITLSVDHRLIDGMKAANFLNRLKYYLEFPKLLSYK